MRRSWSALAPALMCALFLLIRPTTAQEPPAPTPRGQIITQLGWAEAAADDPVALAMAQARRRARIAALVAPVDAIKAEALRLDGARDLLESQLDAQTRRPPKAQRLTTTHLLARQAAQAGVLEAQRSAISQGVSRLELERSWLAEQAAAVAAAAKQRLADQEAARIAEQKRLQDENRRKEEQERKLREAETQRQAAQAELDSIRERERLTKDAQLKQLLNEQGALAERALKRAAEKVELSKSLQVKRDAEVEAFVAARDALNVFTDGLPSTPEALARIAVKEIDPVFAQVRSARRKHRDDMLAAQDVLADARVKRDEAIAAQRDADTRLAQLELSQGDRGGTELGRVGVELARTRAKLTHAELELAELRLSDAVERVGLLADALLFYNTTLERLLPSVSAAAANGFYSPLRDENWYETRRSFQFALMRTARWATARATQLVALPEQVTSVSFWAWVSGFILRLGAAMVLVYMARSQGQRAVRFFTDVLMRRRAMRARATAAIRFSAALRALLLPVLFYISSLWLLSYLTPLLWEATYVRWLVHAFYSYQCLITLVSALVMPRVVREAMLGGRGLDADDLLRDASHADEGDVQRSRKLVRSVKIVLGFWLLNTYVPAGLVAWMGHSVIWRLVSLALFWGFLLVLYSVLSTWRDEIAAGFERIAAPRLPRAATFVSQNKDRLWGVLVVAIASIYVIAYEVAGFVRRVVVDSELWVRLNNFVFRKTIEYKRRGEKDEDEEAGSARVASLPQAYREAFVIAPLTGEPWQPRAADLAAIERERSRWAMRRYQGSMVLAGEPGLGKTSLLEQAAQALGEHPTLRDRPRHHLALADKQLDEAHVLSMLCGLFGLVDAPRDREASIAALLEAPPAIVTIDDIHHLFLRTISGFDSMDTFLEVVHRTDSRHLWVMTCGHFAWSYLQRVRPRAAYVGATILMQRWSEAEIQQLIDERNMGTGMQIDFDDLVITREDGEDYSYEVVKTAQGYFRLLHEFSQGNPAVAMTYWLRSLRVCDEPDKLRVGLFRQPTQRITPELGDDYWFALAALVQHGGLDAKQVAEITNTDVGFSTMALSYFEELDIVRREGRRFVMRPLLQRQILKTLLDANFLYE
jgi:hypothetical protein